MQDLSFIHTDPTHIRLLRAVSKVNNSDLCAMHWCLNHFREAPVSLESPSFQIPAEDGDFHPLDYASLQATIKHFSNCAALDPNHFSCHILRQGGCTFLDMQGASVKEMNNRGDWSSDTVFSYIYIPSLVGESYVRHACTLTVGLAVPLYSSARDSGCSYVIMFLCC